ncbi:hypothetical protein [Streptomyces sp. NEAU-174]|uniref:hypothetical protein n=1 Tax=Streptomyces sp. NEAU-174 TaxID=3458254 RepID=UPI004043E666
MASHREVVLDPGGTDERSLLKANAPPVRAGDVLRCETGGGGGFGPAVEWTPDAIARNLAQGLITDRGATSYGRTPATDAR